MTDGPPCWNSCLGVDRPGFDERLGTWLEMRRPYPPGLVRRIAPADMTDPKKQAEVDEAKRNMLKLMAIGGLAAVGGGAGVAGALQLLQPPLQGLASFPRVQLIFSDGTPITTQNITSQIDPTKTDVYLFPYPLTGELNFLLALDATYGIPPNAVGPITLNNAVSGVTQICIVAYSAICQHLGCVPPFLSYYPASEAQSCGFNGGHPFLHCICHGSTYDPYAAWGSTGGANILTGPTVNGLPQCLLETDSNGNLFAYKVIGVPVKGHFTTLTGGSAGPVPAPVTQTAVGTIASGAQRCP